MKIQYSPYSLVKKNKVNAADETIQQNGSLIRIFESADIWGVADLCPWPTLGDLSLAEEISQEGKLFRRALELAHEDLSARKEKRSLLFDKWIDNNILVLDYSQFDFSNPKLRGHTLKIKADNKILRLANILEQAPSDLVFRIDFNGQLTPAEIQLFLDRVSKSVQIEYIEDPCAYDGTNWRNWNAEIPLARDFVRAEDHFSVCIVKPAREQVNTDRSFVITSSMDHPVGVAHALRIAQTRAKEKSGLLTLDLYEETNMHHYFRYRNQSEINFTEEALRDYGIGMSSALCQLDWKDL